jgi:alcohol dehydrogenase (cytochrome c)
MLRGRARLISAMRAKRRSLLGVIGAGGERMGTRIGLLLLCMSMHAPLATAQGLDAAALLKPATDAWPSYNGDYSGRRYSTLDQINAGNIHSLTLAWAFNTRGSVLKSTPLEVNGILYFSAPDNVWAVDARFGRMIWHYQRPSEGDHIGHRGLGMYKDWLYFTTPDAHLISLDAKDGKVRWDVELADAKLGYFSTMAPLVIRDHLITGVSGDRKHSVDVVHGA